SRSFPGARAANRFWPPRTKPEPPRPRDRGQTMTKEGRPPDRPSGGLEIAVPRQAKRLPYNRRALALPARKESEKAGLVAAYSVSAKTAASRRARRAARRTKSRAMERTAA